MGEQDKIPAFIESSPAHHTHRNYNKAKQLLVRNTYKNAVGSILSSPKKPRTKTNANAEVPRTRQDEKIKNAIDVINEKID